MEAEVAERLATCENKIEHNENKIASLVTKTDKLESLTLSVERLAISIENMAKEQADYRKKQNELANRLLEVEQKPYKSKASTLDKYLEKIGFTIVGALISYLLYSLFGI